ncbi:MAG: hypothetical protein Q8Q23_01980 [bacterium]|nr:hypothetical protein [bacterium]
MAFQYDKKIDNWSHRMISGLTEIWGVRLNKNNDKLRYKTLPLLKNYLDGYWQKHGTKIIKRLNSIFKLNHSPDDFLLYLNTAGASLHNTEKQFISLCLHHSFISYPTVIIHELSHIYFYQYLRKSSITSLNNNEANELKEIITVIINTEFLDYIDCLDVGYPDHKKIRARAKKIWQQNKNMDAFMAKMIKIYKK